MKQDFTLEILSDNNFSILNRIVNILNRRRVRIKRLVALEDEDFRKGRAILLLYATTDMMEKVKHQLEKIVEVEYAQFTEGSEQYFVLGERNNKQVA
jgi:acetolactate synthase-1/3 small subunit